jgi:hypothetical protein
MAFGQLNKPIPIVPIDTVLQQVASLGTEFTHFATELKETTYQVSQYLPQDPLEGYLYIIVRALNASKFSSC